MSLPSYNLDAPGWCCGWDDSDENRLYCGLVDDTVMVFDVRNTRDHIYHLKDHALTKKKPIHSIVHLGGPKNSILCANLDCLYKWDLDGDTPTCSVIEMNSQGRRGYEIYVTVEGCALTLRCLGFHPYSLSYDKPSATILASFRSQTSTKHIHGSLADNIFEVRNVFCNPQKQTALARTWHFSKPRTSELNDYDTEYVICAGDEVNKSVSFELNQLNCKVEYTNAYAHLSSACGMMFVRSEQSTLAATSWMSNQLSSTTKYTLRLLQETKCIFIEAEPAHFMYHHACF